MIYLTFILFKKAHKNQIGLIAPYEINLFGAKNKLNAARFGSDILLYGVVLGSIPITPILLKENYRSMILTNLEVLAINGLITDVTKYLVGRQRPSSYFFNTRDEKKDAFKSFFSGHTSTSFAIATSTAMILSKEFSSQKKLLGLHPTLRQR